MLRDKAILKWTKTPLFWAIIIALIYAFTTIFITIHLMHDSFNTNAFDLGIFTQDLKNTLQQHILYSSAGQYQLAHHFSPILFSLVPIYWLFPHAQTLLVIQGLVLAFSGYLIYVVARKYDFSQRTSLILEALFFLNPLVWGVALFDFHEVVFAIPSLLIMFLGLKEKKWVFFILGLFFALASKEDTVLALGAFGALLIITNYRKQKKIEKTSIIVFCSALLTYLIGVTVSHFLSSGEPARIISYFTNRYAYIGLPLSIAIPMALHTVFSMGTLFLIGAYLAPFAFLPLLSPKWVIPAMLIMLSGILSTHYGQHNELMQYPAVAIPFLFIALLEVLPKLTANQEIRSIIKKTQNRGITYSLIFVILISFVIISEGRIQLISIPDRHDVIINQVIASIPNNSSVSTTNNVFPHLCSRTDTYLLAAEGNAIAPTAGIVNGDWGYPDKDTEYVVIDLKNYLWNAANIKLISNKYNLITDINGVLLYKLKS